MKSRFVRFNQLEGLAMRSCYALYEALRGRTKGAIYCNKPILEAHPGPPLSHKVTGRVFFAPL